MDSVGNLSVAIGLFPDVIYDCPLVTLMNVSAEGKWFANRDLVMSIFSRGGFACGTVFQCLSRS